MKVKISDKLICIPPFISTTWDQISFLQSEKELMGTKFTLFLHLKDGKVVTIPELDASIVDIAFSAHIQHLERTNSQRQDIQQKSPQNHLSHLMNEGIATFPIRLGSVNGMDGIETAFQHNPAQAQAPNLPKEVVEKIATIAKIITNGDLSAFPKPEPHCNCLHCQVARSIHHLPEHEIEDEIVTNEDLTFRTWEIEPSKEVEKLYVVTNPIDPREQYSVYLGEPIGCTCGEAHCEHIHAVLSS